MAITDSLTPSSRSSVDEAVSVTIELFKRLGVVGDKESLEESLSGDYRRLTKLGDGRLYVELPATVTFDRLLQLADELAQKAGCRSVYQWPNFWVPGTEKESLTKRELNGSAIGYTARLALYSDNQYDKLLHFGGLPYDRKYAEPGEATQLDSLKKMQVDFAAQSPGVSLRAADHRDFLVWYIMDLLCGVPRLDVVLAQGWMRVPLFDRRIVCGHSLVGDVFSCDGQVWFGRDRGDDGLVDYGVGVSAGFL